MATVTVAHRCADFETYRAARVKSLFNVDSGADKLIHAELPIEDLDWAIGVVVGPSGSGKSTLGRALYPDAFYEPTGWPDDAPIVDAIAPDGDFDAVTGALAAVGLGDVPAWLRPYPVLSNGERFRADLARIVAEAPPVVVVDEFTSVVDRQIAKVGAGAFAKSWRRTGGRAVLLTCHYDVLEWLEPDWTYDTGTQEFTVTKGCLHRPRLEVDIRQVGHEWWPAFRPHHYLNSGPMPYSKAYIAVVDGEPVAHLGVSTKAVGRSGHVEARACRLVVMPEWQGAGIGMRFLNAIAQAYLEGRGHVTGGCTTLFHTSHPGLCAGLRRDPRWRQLSARLTGEPGAELDTLERAGQPSARQRRTRVKGTRTAGLYGAHWRAVQGFRYVGPQPRSTS